MLQSDWFWEWAVFSDLAHSQRNPGMISLLCFRGCESLSIKQRRLVSFLYTQTLISGFNMREFPLLWKSPFKSISS